MRTSAIMPFDIRKAACIVNNIGQELNSLYKRILAAKQFFADVFYSFCRSQEER